MNKPILGLLLLCGWLSAQAACSDLPAPKVDWRLCDKRNQRLPDGMQLAGANLQDAQLNLASLRFARLPGADLSRASLTGANLTGADLSGADLRGANLTDAVLYLADLSGANLSGAVFVRANLTGANLTGANLAGAKWKDSSKICGVDSVGVCK